MSLEHNGPYRTCAGQSRIRINGFSLAYVLHWREKRRDPTHMIIKGSLYDDH